jgi:hypothetical protein
MRPIVALSLALTAFCAVLGLIAVGGWHGAVGGAMAGAGASIASVWLLGAEPQQ